MRKLFIYVVMILAVCFSGLVYAGDLNFTLKQGFVYVWEDQAVKNLTTLSIANTQPFANAPKWVNAIFDGWMLDIGYAFDSTTYNSGAVLLGRELGTLGKYLPINFPLKDKISIALYPIGVYGESLFDHPKFKLASGAAIIKLEIKF